MRRPLGPCLALALCAACGESGRARPGPAAAPPTERRSSANVFDRAAAEAGQDTALADLRAAAAAEPGSAAAQMRLAVGLRRAGLRRDALAHFQRAAELDPGNDRYRLELGSALTAVARLAEAEATYRTLLDHAELRPIVLHNLGNIALRRNQLEAALRHYEQALAERPDYLLARYHHAVTLQQAGRYDEAYDSFRRAAQLEPTDEAERAIHHDAIYRLGVLEMTRGDPQAAADALARLLRAVPDHPNALYGYGQALMMLGREQEAREAFARHLQLPDRQSGRTGYLGSPGLDDHAAAAGEVFHFEDATDEAGIDYVNLCGAPPGSKQWISETLGAGAAWLDYDGDGVLDLFVVNGSAHDRPAGGGEPSRMYRGIGGGRFEDVTPRAGVGHRGWGHGVAVGDYDNDGDPDLYVTSYGPNVLYRNEGNGTFRDVTAVAGVGDDRWGTSAAFFDLEGDGDLDLYVANYLECDPAVVPRPGQSPLCGYKGIDVLCGPKPLPPQQDVLYRNDGNGRFTDVTRAAGVWLEEPLYGLGVVTGDYDRDGDQDVYVANDSVRNLLWSNRGDGTFVDLAIETMTGLGPDGRAQSSMGTDFGDYDGDGWPDIAVTNFSDDLNTLYRNAEGRYFVDESSAAGLSVTYSALSWGVGFRDLDNDGRQDLFIANGHIYPEMDRYDLGTSYRQTNHLFHNQDGTRLVEVAADSGPGLAVRRSFRGAAFADYDDDGDVDVFLTAIDDRALLLENVAPRPGHFLEVRLVGTRSNRDGVGARVQVTAGGGRQTRERNGGGSYLSASEGRLHFGLGAAAIVERLEVRWPSGALDVLAGVAADRTITVVEGRGEEPRPARSP